MQTYYDILGVPPDASQAQIKISYRELIKRYHPDRNPDSSEATKQTQIINQAYSTLRDPAKRYEYDNLIKLQTQSHPSSQQHATVQDAPEPEVPHYKCEVCGRQDPSLRVTIFLWVVSLIYVTSKRGWGKILCSTCRIKYSILWNLEVWFAGWWGFPFGPIYTIEALFKNAKGGIQPEDNNASLLAMLAYDFYQQARYRDAYDALRESQKLKSTSENAAFLNHLRQYLKPRRAPSVRQQFSEVHPLFYNIPIIALLSIISFALVYSIDWSSSTTSRRAPQYIPIAQPSQPLVAPSTPDYIKIAPKYGINIDQVNNSASLCNQAIANVASHIKARVPYIGATYEAGATIHNYELDRDKLDQNVIHPFTNQIYSEMRRVSQLLDGFSIGDTSGLFDEGKAKIKLHGFLNSQYQAMVATYFNCAILEYSIPIVNHFYSDGVILQSYSMKIRQLGEQADVTAWLAHSRYGSAFEQLTSVISDLFRYQAKTAEMKSALARLKARIDEDKSVLDTWERRLQYYDSNGMNDEYNNLVSTYNSRVSLVKSRIEDHNNLVEQYNDFVRSNERGDLDGAFNECLDPRILFSGYQRVDLHTNKRTPALNR